MKRNIFLALLIAATIDGFCQPVVYFDFVTHNEETNQWNSTLYYNANRAKLLTLANYFQANGITWNMQSDWVYLTNVLSKDSALMGSTNNKNVLRWMHEDKGVEMDPHAHESRYIYPDVVNLMDSLGLPESKLIGGTIYNDSNGINIWTNLVNGQYGIIFPDRFWQPDYMMGGGTPNHVADVKYYGFWNPQSPTSYLTHDTVSRLRHIGVGCSIKIKDTSAVANVVAELKDAVQKVKTGQYPSNGFYLQTIFFEQGDLNNLSFYNKVIEVADSVNAMVASGDAQWKTLKQAYTQWETTYNAQMFQWDCGQIATGVEKSKSENNLRLYPNPASDKIKFELNGIDLAAGVDLEVYNVLGELVYQLPLFDFAGEIDVKFFPKGIFLCRLKKNLVAISSAKIIIQ